MDSSKALYQYTLRLADNSMIMAQRLSELCSYGPYLEEDIATTNIALDLLGQANALYNYASQQNINNNSADNLAFRRNKEDFLNYLLVEQPNGHFGDTVSKIFIFSAFQKCFFSALKNSTDSQLSAIASKSLKEVRYHLRHSKAWVIRLGDGTKESKERIQTSINNIWPYTAELFENNKIDEILIEEGVGVDSTSIKDEWNNIINTTIYQAKLDKLDTNILAITVDKKKHLRHLGDILKDMQYLQRTYPDAEW